MTHPAKNTICIWYDRDAESAARFYAETFPDSSVVAVHRAPADFPSGKEGDVLTVDFVVMGIPCLVSACGWCRDKWGVNWQITPVALTRGITSPDRAAARRAFEAMMPMKKIDVAAMEAAVRG